MSQLTRSRSRRGREPHISTSDRDKHEVISTNSRVHSPDSLRSLTSPLPTQADVPPVYSINLSLPPRERYKAIAMDYKHQLENLIGLFDELLESFTNAHKIYMAAIKKIARVVLRRVYSEEETEELRGIHDVTGIDMYLLVVFNVLLDCLMGCTSGGVRVRDDLSGGSMLHFRTLDWGMDPLREVVVQLEFKNGARGDIIARSITYVGFVGVLTGVRWVT